MAAVALDRADDDEREADAAARERVDAVGASGLWADHDFRVRALGEGVREYYAQRRAVRVWLRAAMRRKALGVCVGLLLQSAGSWLCRRAFAGWLAAVQRSKRAAAAQQRLATAHALAAWRVGFARMCACGRQATPRGGMRSAGSRCSACCAAALVFCDCWCPPATRGAGGRDSHPSAGAGPRCAAHAAARAGIPAALADMPRPGGRVSAPQ